MKRKWTDEDLKRAVAESANFSGVVKKLHLAHSGVMYKSIRKHILRLGLNTEHWVSILCVASKREIMALPLNEFFVQDCQWSNKSIRKRIIKEGLLEYKCKKCGIDCWQNDTLILQLDHINGNKTDNRLENLRWLCPNCHSQTKTWGAKSRKVWRFCECGKEIRKGSTRCVKCNNKFFEQPTKIDWPTTEELIRMVKEENFVKVAKKLGVSDNAIRKRIRNHPAP